MKNIICFVYNKVELMGGRLTVTSRVNAGSTFTFILPYKVATPNDHSDDQDEFSDMSDHQLIPEDTTNGYFQFQPLLRSLYSSSDGPVTGQNFLTQSVMQSSPIKLNGFASDLSHALPSTNIAQSETISSCIFESAQKYPNGESLSKEYESCSSSQASNVGGALAMESETAVSSRRQETDQHETTSERCEESSKPDSKPKILLVEDNRINIMVSQSMMKQLGHPIDIATNGVEAIRALQRSNYDLVLMVH